MSPRASLLLVVGAALAAFAAALHGSFVNWDDIWLILRNPYLRGLHHVPQALDPLSNRILMGAEYLPVRDLSNILDYFLFGTEPTLYRLGNWLLYGLSAGTAYAFLREALGSPRAALAGALLWAVHPLHAEVVAWASARKDLLNAVFALLAATLFLRSARTGSRTSAWGAAGAFLLATLSKTSAAALPFLLAAWEVLAGDAALPLRARAAAALRRAAPMMIVAAAGAALNAWHQSRAHVEAEWRAGGWLPNLLVMAGVHLRYVRQVVFPSGLAADYSVEAEGAGYLVPSLWLLASLALLAGSLVLLRRSPRAGLCAIWWFAILAPVSNVLFPITNVSADRYLFLPSLGPCALAGIGLERLSGAGPRAARAARAALAAAVLVLGVAAAAQARVWRDGLSLWSRAVEASPSVGRAWMNYGESLAFAGRREEALAAWKRMVEAEPRNALYWIHLGSRVWEIGGPARAEEVEGYLRTAVAEAEPDNGGPLVALAWILDARGRRAEAVPLLEEAARRQPGLSRAHLNLGLWHLSEQRWVRAVEELEEALRLGLPLEDEVVVHQRLFEAFEGTGDFERARHHREERERLMALSRGE